MTHLCPEDKVLPYPVCPGVCSGSGSNPGSRFLPWGRRWFVIPSKLFQSRLWRRDTLRTDPPSPPVFIQVPTRLSARRGCGALKIERTCLGATLCQALFW